MILIEPTIYALISSNVPDSPYPTWDNTTSYSTGDYCYVDATHGEYKALTNNSGKYPPDSPLDWQWVGTANKYKMFDQYLNTQTINSGSIVVEISSADANSIYLGNLVGDTISFEVFDIDDNVIETQTINLINDPTDWFDYFYGNWIKSYKNSVIIKRQTISTGGKFRITISNDDPNAEVRAGIFLCGTDTYFGATQYNFKTKLIDYSTISEDKNTGVIYLEKGNTTRMLDMDIFTSTAGVNTLMNKLQSVTGLPIAVYSGDNEIASLYGFIQHSEILVKSPTGSVVNCSIKGLI